MNEINEIIIITCAGLILAFLVAAVIYETLQREKEKKAHRTEMQLLKDRQKAYYEQNLNKDLERFKACREKARKEQGKKMKLIYYQDRLEKHRWRLQSANGQIVGASSQGFSTHQKAVENMRKVFLGIKNNGNL